MKTIECNQNSPEWFAAKCGIPSASNFDKIINTKGMPSKQREKYMHQLAGERVAGVAEETYQNATMLRGIEMEEEARLMYELSTGTVVKEVGFCLADKGYGCSPDGLVGTTGQIEIKCPNIATHVGYLLKNVLPIDYFQQIHGQLLVTGREWCDFYSYYPGLKPLVIRVERDEAYIRKLAVELELFCGKLDEITNQIK